MTLTHERALNLRHVRAAAWLAPLLAACSPSTASTSAGTTTPVATPASTTMADALTIADRYRVTAVTHRRIPHAEYWKAVAPSLDSPRLKVEEVGTSMQGRALRSITFGRGSTTVLLWSQMHGDEATATMALADILAWLSAPGDDARRDRLAGALTVVMVPMLNPDGAERFQRENAAGIDINRDARLLSTPEARTLKGLHDRLKPAFGFNLHDQNARTRVGRNGPQAGIALLAPAADADRSWGPLRTRARLVAAGLAQAFGAQIPGRVSKYDDAFNPRAFGDLMAAWGTSTVLIESGALPEDPDKQALRRLNAAAIIAALDAIATGAIQQANPDDYERLPFNASGAYDLLVRGGHLILPGAPPLRADVAINYDDAVARTGGRVREVGDLSAVAAVDTMDASGLFLHVRAEAISGGVLPLGARAAIDVRAGATVESALRRQLDRDKGAQ